MIRSLFTIALWVGVFLPTTTFAACTPAPGTPRIGCGFNASGAPVAGAVASEADYGPILCDICQVCATEGNCTLTDFMIATGNVGNYALGLTGAIALILFVIGGMYWIMAAGRGDWVKKGFGFLKAAVIGMTIAFAAQLLLQTVKNALISGSTGSVDVTAPVDCTTSSDYTVCGRNSVCVGQQCLSFCQLQQIQATLSDEPAASTEALNFQCVGSSNAAATEYQACYENYCPNASDLCCNFTRAPAITP